MARPKRTDGKTKIQLFVTNGYRYAISQDSVRNPETGKYSHPKITYGTVTEDGRFVPNKRFLQMSSQERKRLAFPIEWNLDAIDSAPLTPSRTPGRPSYTGKSRSLLYGTTLFFEKVAEVTGLRNDLTIIFGKSEIVDDLLSLAYYDILNQDCYNHFEARQKVEWYPATNPLNPSKITRLTQSLTEQNKQDLFACRQARIIENSWIAIDSTSFSLYSTRLADSHYGKNKEHDPLPQVNLLVLYDVKSSMPVYYRMLPGNIPDARTLETTFKELNLKGFNTIQFLLDRGYITFEVLELLVKKKISFIMMAKTADKKIKSTIEAIDVDEFCVTKNYIGKHQLYGMDFDYPFEVHVKNELRKTTPLRLCLFFDPELQGIKKKEVADFIYHSSESLQSHIDDNILLSDEAIQEFSKYFTLRVNENTRMLVSFEEKVATIKQQYTRSGFFACLCNNMDKETYSLTDILDKYRMRDEQEKSFMFIKSTQNGRRLRTSTELSTEGRIFIQFITLILNSYMYHIYNSSPTLMQMFPTRRHMYNELMSIRRIEHPNKAKIITEFVGKQIDIFDAFDFEIPAQCRPSSRKKKDSKVQQKK